MAKPSLLPLWGTTSTNIVEPSLLTKQQGWQNGDRADSSWMNWYQNLVYQWLAWLDAGDLEAVDLTLSGDLDVAGDATIGGDVEAENLYFTSTETKQLDIHGTSYGSFGTTASGYKQSSGAAQVHDIAIELPLGAKIWGYSLRLFGNGADSLTHKLVKINYDSTEADVGSVTEPALAATWVRKFNNFAAETITIDTRYVIRVTAAGSGQRVAAPTVDWTLPKP